MQTITITDVENNIEFEFLNDKALGGLINQVEGFEYPVTKVVVEDIASKGGAKAVTSKFGRRVCSFVYHITCDVLEERRALLAAMRQTGFLKLVEFTTIDNIDLQFEAYVNKVIAPYTSMMKPILIELVAPDWRFFSQTLHNDEVDDADSEVLVNAGNEITDPVIRVYGPFTVALVTNLATSDSFTLTGSVADGHYIEIDTNLHTVLLDGITPKYSFFTGDFFSLVPGNNDISLAATGPGANTHLGIDWRDAYNGV